MTISEEVTDISNRLGNIANMYACGQNGLPKNGTTAVALHQACNAIKRATRALEDAEYCRDEGLHQIAEHLMEGPCGVASATKAHMMALQLFPGFTGRD